MLGISELKKFEIFGGLSQKQLEEVATITTRKSYKANSHVYEHGDPAKHLFVVSKGLVTLKEIKPGDELGIAFEMRERGEVFGAASLMKPRQYTLTAICLEDCEIAALDADKLSKLCETDPDLGYKIMSKIAELYFERYKIAKRQLHEMAKGPTLITALPG